MVKDPIEPRKESTTNKESSTLLDECSDHFQQSDDFISTLRDTDWDDKEAMLLGKSEDQLSKKAKSKINDPRLSTIVFERSARVMAREPDGHAYAESEDDIGKNMFMNLLLPHFRKKDTDQYSHLLKLRFLDMYSHVYGSCYGLTPWRVDARTGFVGPSLNVLRMRDSFPQPGISSLDHADWFDHRTWVGIDWLQRQDPNYWNMQEIELLAHELKDAKDSGDLRKEDTTNAESYVERQRYPNNPKGSAKFPMVEIITEYRRDKWVTWTPQRPNLTTSRPHILRVVADAFPGYRLPVVVKHSFPLLDSPIGLGEFERGQTLQYAMNSLINLYMDGVKYSIFPPVMIDPNNVVPSSIKWGAGERWYMNTPGRDVQPFGVSPQGLSTFQSTYEFLLGALYNQSGTTSVAGEQGGQSGLGKTPDAIKFVSERESARDEWDRFMMEDTCNQIYGNWISMITHNLENDVTLRLFGVEAREIAKRYPDIKDLFGKQVKPTKSGDAVKITVNKELLGGPDENYDWVMETGSTMAASAQAEGEAVTDVLKAVIENGEKFEAALNKKNKSLDAGELFTRWLEARKLKGLDKIIVDMPTAEVNAAVAGGGEVPPPTEGSIPPEAAAILQQAQAQSGGAPAQAPQAPMAPIAPVVPTPEVTPQVASVAPVSAPAEQMSQQVPANGDFRDPQVAEMAAQLLGGIGGIPPVQ